ncbi:MULTISPECIES: glycoside hydrolase family 38 C-terminal domain-containing protein [unclassified Arthrobacter]|uniref:alpha-mannosidase n=1 Tax=unclassified Arthrobacter TaxID=235627 RepID=UPI00159D4FF1|nr:MULTISPECIES: glycoside hydrolase family 38 C-terminal domain-containing protein [unclassified Arthrobacter]MCQ9165254.1 glycosyl hydrolase-related protein [Arthrobacter sp. STN4]NVM99550.1 alpha-mannosidase [Arthrobacter sp. SDTb3-6]
MHDKHTLIENRLKRVLAERIRPAIHTPVAPLDLTAWHVEGGAGEPVDPAVALELARTGATPAGGSEGPAHDAGASFAPFAVGQAWGPAWGTSWIHVTGTVPPEAAGHAVELVVDLGFSQSWPGFQAEGLVYRPDGTPVKALNPLNTWVPVAERARGGEAVDLFVEAAANPFVFTDNPFVPTMLGEKSTAGPEPRYTLARADINIFHTDVWELVQDLEVLSQLAAELDLGDPRRWDILYALERALDAMSLTDIAGTAAAARTWLAEVLARPANASAHRLTAVGHAHIDSAWLWPVRETVRKVARTTSNVVQLLADHPGLQYAMSSAQQYEWLKEQRPEVYAKVKAAVAGGRFIPVGGMWVESDTNMVGSEAMARQFTYGQRFFRENFGIQCQEVWLPDSFGYSAALPQIVKLAGAKWFLTQKISWNTDNKFPHHTFNWEGIDGTRVFTHFPPVDTYNSQLSGQELAHAVRNFRDKGASNHSLVPFGWGDGGGGPTREMLARARRTHDLEGSPRVTIAAPRDFFTAAEAEYANAPVWKGELYLELHRGTYTSQALTKQGNRRSEHLLREAELWSATAAVRGLLDYPYGELDRLWKLVLLHQFHDILPGSSIAWVHREAAERYAEIAADLEEIIAEALAVLAPPVVLLPLLEPAEARVPTSPASGALIHFNASPYPRRGIAALGAGVPDPATADVTVERDGADVVVHNGLVSVRFGPDGVITSIVDVAAERELVPAGQGANLLQLHADFPNMWDAWDIDEFYKNTVADIRELDSLDMAVLDGHAEITIKRSFRASHITQQVRISPDSKTITVHNDVDWHEQETLLKAAFPLDIHTDQARFETQYGHIQRPTHENTSWDNARFEVCAHRWVHVGEPGFGAAVINDSTYGHDVSRHPGANGSSFTTVRLSLLRGPRFPDPGTDQGPHSFSYGLVVGAEVADAVAAGYALNLPWRAVPDEGIAVEPLVRADSQAAVIEAVKLADDRSGDVIVRLYEPLGARARVALSASFPVASAVENNLLEQPYDAGSLTVTDGRLHVTLRPFQILTLRLKRGA